MKRFYKSFTGATRKEVALKVYSLADFCEHKGYTFEIMPEVYHLDTDVLEQKVRVFSETETQESLAKVAEYIERKVREYINVQK